MGLEPSEATPVGIIAGREDWLRQLQQDYGPVADRLISAYERMILRLQPYQTALTDRLVRMADEGVPITASTVRGIPQWGQLLARIEIELNGFARLVDAELGLVADAAVSAGSDQARQLTLFTLPEVVQPALDAAFIRPDPEALRRLIDYVDGDAMQGKVAAFGEAAAREFADMAISGFAQGKHPVTMARQISRWLDQVPFFWAETTLRTAYLWSYRGANHLTYAANDHLLEGWMWWSARDTATCYSCWAQHGKIFPTDQVLIDHHRGRCTPMPLVTGADWWQGLPAGPDLFATLSEAEQRQILKSPSLFDLFKQGKLPWEALSASYQDDIYGEMLREARVGDILRAA